MSSDLDNVVGDVSGKPVNGTSFPAKNSADDSSFVFIATIFPRQRTSPAHSGMLALHSQGFGLMVAALFGGAGLGLGPHWALALDADLTLARETVLARPGEMLRESLARGQGARR